MMVVVFDHTSTSRALLKSLLWLPLFMAITPAAAIDCADLKPLPPKNEDVSFKGKLDASVDGFFAKLASVGTKAEGTYRQVATNVLAEIPNADKLYMWERVLYLNCQLLSDAKDVSSEKKLQMVGDLYAKFGSPPPTLTPSSSNTASTSGNNSPIVQGNDNTVNAGDKN
jgi:hypothetical protein